MLMRMVLVRPARRTVPLSLMLGLTPTTVMFRARSAGE
jgi:hypothetical protein